MSDGKVSIELTAETARFVSTIKQASDQFKSAFDTMGKSAAQAGASLDKAFSTLKVRSLADIRKDAADAQMAFNAISASAGRNSAEAQRAFLALRARLRELGQEAKGTGTAIDSGLSPIAGLGSRLGGAVAALASIGTAMAGVRAVVQAGLGFEKIESTLRVSTGSTEAARREFEFIKKTANELGLELNSTAAGYAKFSAASRGTALEGEKTREVFLSVSKAATAMKLSSAETEGIFLALSQMMAKGKVQAEEFRGQLGERLPLAMQAATKATGLTTAEFSKLLDEGGVISEEFLPKFAKALEELVGPAAIEGAQSLQAQINRLSNAWQEFLLIIAQSGVVKEMTAQLKAWIAELQKMRETGELQQRAKAVADAIVAIGKAAAYVIEFIARFHKEILAVIAGLAAFKVVGFALEVAAFAKSLGLAAVAARALGLAMRLIPLVALGTLAVEAFTLAAGALSASKELANATRPAEMLRASLARIKDEDFGGVLAAQAFEASSAMSAAFQAEKTRHDQIVASRRGLLGAIKGIFQDEAAADRQHAADLVSIAQQGADKLISIKERQRAALESTLQRLTSAYQTAVNKIKQLEDELAATVKGFEDVKFDIQLGGMTEAQQFVALQQKAAQIIAEMTAIRANAAAQGRTLTEQEIAKMKELGTEAQSTARSIAGLGQTGPDAAVQKTQAISAAMNVLDQASRQAGGAIKDAISAEQANANGLKSQINDTQAAITALSTEIGKLRDIKIQITASEGDTAKLEGIVKQLQDAAGKEYVFMLQSDPSAAEKVIADLRAKAEQPTNSQHLVQPNTTQADQAIARLQQPTSSMHTVYVRTVETHAAGGPVGSLGAGPFRRMSGSIRGPGTGTSDSIPAMLSDGEFVLKAAAVRKWGLGFLHALNAGIMPGMPVPRFATGGPVLSAQSGGNRDIVDLRFKLDSGANFTVQSDRSVARGLAKALRGLSRG